MKKLTLFCAVAVVVLLASTSTSEAQGRRGPVRVVVASGYYYDPFFYAEPWYGEQIGYPMRYGYGRRYEPDASVRLEVKPKQAEVYVDGYYAGIVDDFDGTFQRLRVEPGEHEIELWLDGYRTVRQKVYLSVDNTFRIKYQMERLGPGEPLAPKPQPIDAPRAQGGAPLPTPDRGPAVRRAPQPQYPPDQYPPQQPRGQAPPPPPPQDGRGGGRNNAAYGSLAVKVQPGDAEISIDGEQWRSPGGQDRLVVEVAEGSHTVEIRKPGFRTYVTQVDVRRGQTTPLNVSLRGEQQ